MKQVTFKKEAMEKMVIGLDKAAEAVAGTLGPKGLNVYFDDPMTPEITNDGATIASRIILTDKREDSGAYVIRNTTSQTNDDVGDGTTTTAVLVHSLIHECLKRPENAMEIKESLKEAGEKAIKLLAKKTTKLNSDSIKEIASISAESKSVADLITNIFNKLGNEAVVSVEDSKAFTSDYEIVEGYEAEAGFMSYHFANDKSGKAVYENIPVLVTDIKISNLQDIKPLIEREFKDTGITSCVIACSEIDDSMLGMFVLNKLRKVFDFLVVRAIPAVLEDIEAVTGATMVSNKTGITFQNINLSHLGKAKKVVSSSSKTLFIGNGISASLRALDVEKQAENEPNQYLAEMLRQRVAKLKGGIAILRIGAATDFERNYLKRKAEDAVKAVQAAIAEGIVEGGGLALWRIANEMSDKTIGEQILKKALKSPFQRIIENAGKDYTEVVANMPQDMGYDAKNNIYVNMQSVGILDPAKVERCALENAISAASQFITTFAVITDDGNTKQA